MPWTTEQKVKSLFRLQWTIASEPSGDPGEYIVRVRELPDLLVIGTREEIDAEFWNAFRASIEARLEFGDPIPLPAGVSVLPWDLPERKLVVRTKAPRVADATAPVDESDTAYSPAALVAAA